MRTIDSSAQGQRLEQAVVMRTIDSSAHEWPRNHPLLVVMRTWSQMLMQHRASENHQRQVHLPVPVPMLLLLLTSSRQWPRLHLVQLYVPGRP